MTIVGDAFINVDPDLTGFKGKLQAGVDRAASGVVATVRTALEAAGLRREVTVAATQAERGQLIVVGTDADTDELRADVTAAVKAAGAGQVIEVGAEVDGSELRQSLRSAIAAAQAGNPTIPVDIDLTGFGGLRQQVRVAVAEAGVGQSVKVPVETDGGSIRKLQTDLRGLNGDLSFFSRILGTLKFPAAISGVGLLSGGLSALASSTVAAVSALGPLTGLLGALPGLAIAAGAAVGTAALAFLGVGDALTAITQAEAGAGRAMASGANQAKASARAREAAAEQVADAVRRQADAERDAARATEEAAQRVADASRDLADARTAAAEANEEAGERFLRAAERVIEAERQLARVQRDSADAERQLQELRRSAAERMEDLGERVSDGALEEERALLRVTEAQEALNEATADPKATATERANRALSLREAVESLDDLRRRRARDAAELARQQQAARDGTDEVGRAVRDLTDRVQQRADAEVAVNKAVQERIRAEVAVGEVAKRGARDVADAVQAVADAQAEATRTQLDNQRDLEDAARAVERALRDQARAGEEAGSSGAGGIDKVGAAMAKLSPAAREFVGLIQGLQPVFDDLRNRASEGLFPGVIDGIQSLQGLLPVIAPAISATAEALGDLAREGGAMLASGPWSADFATIASQNATIIDRFGTVAFNLLDALRNITVAAQPLVDWLTQTAVAASENIKQWAEAGRTSGSFEQFFADAATAAEQLGRIVGNLVGIFANVGRAGSETGRGLLDSLEDMTQRWEDWTDSITGQNAIRDWFSDSKPVMSEFAGLVGDVVKAFAGLGDSEALLDVIKMVRADLLPALADLADGAQEAFAPALVDLVTELVRLFGAFAGESGPLTLMVEALGELAKVVRILLDNVPGLQTAAVVFGTLGLAASTIGLAAKLPGISGFVKVFQALGKETGPLGKLGTTLGKTLAPALAGVQGLLGTTAFSLGALAVPIGAVVAGVAAIVGGLVLAYFHIQPFRDAVDGLVDVIGEGLVGAFRALQQFTDEIWPQVQEAITHVLNVVEAAIDAWVAVAKALWRAFGDELLTYTRLVFDTIRGVVEGALKVVRGIIQTVLALINGDWGKAWDGIKTVLAGVWDGITAVVRGAIGGVQLLISGVLSAIRLVWDTAWAGMRLYIETVWAVITTVVRTAIDTVASILRGVVGGLATFFTTTWQGISDTVTGAFDLIVETVSGMPERITRAAVGMWDGIRNAFRSAINWIIDAWNRLEFTIPGFDPPGPGPTFGGFTLGVPNIPRLHTGGDVTATMPRTQGLRPDERVAVLQVGERVQSRSAVAAAGDGRRVVIQMEAGAVVVQAQTDSLLAAQLAGEQAVGRALVAALRLAG